MFCNILKYFWRLEKQAKAICSLSENICDRRPPSHYVGRAPPRDCSCISELPRAASTAAAVMESARIALENPIFRTWEILLFIQRTLWLGITNLINQTWEKFLWDFNSSCMSCTNDSDVWNMRNISMNIIICRCGWIFPRLQEKA